MFTQSQAPELVPEVMSLWKCRLSEGTARIMCFWALSYGMLWILTPIPPLQSDLRAKLQKKSGPRTRSSGTCACHLWTSHGRQVQETHSRSAGSKNGGAHAFPPDVFFFNSYFLLFPFNSEGDDLVNFLQFLNEAVEVRGKCPEPRQQKRQQSEL